MKKCMDCDAPLLDNAVVLECAECNARYWRDVEMAEWGD